MERTELKAIEAYPDYPSYTAIGTGLVGTAFLLPDKRVLKVYLGGQQTMNGVEDQIKAAKRGLAPMIFEVGLDYTVMELIVGETLLSWSKKVSVRRKLEVVLGAVELAEALEGIDVIHEDLHEENIIVTRSGLVAVDFDYRGENYTSMVDTVSYILHELMKKEKGWTRYRISGIYDLEDIRERIREIWDEYVK